MTPKHKGASGGRPRPVYVSLDELAQRCARCGHQNGGHIGGTARSGWPIFDPIWASASGSCTALECDCPSRTTDPAARATPVVPEAPPVIVPPPPIATALTGPCGHGTGPCGATPTRPYAEGPRCATHAPTAITGGRAPEADHIADLAEKADTQARRWAA